MNRIEELIQKCCPYGVEYKRLEDCCNILDNKRKPVTKSARNAGEYPYYGANGILDYVSDYIFDGTYVLVGEDGSVVTDKGTPVVTWAEGKIWVNNHAHIVEEAKGVLIRYLYHALQTINVAQLIHGNIPKLNQGDFRSLEVPVPPMEVQREIVHILDSFTFYTSELSAELSARREQYNYYRDKLLTFNTDIKEKELKDVLSIRNGRDYKQYSNGEYPVYGTGGIMAYIDRYAYDKPSVLIPRKGSLNKLYYVETPFWTVDTIFYTEIDASQVIPKYVYYFLQKEHLEELNEAGGVPSLTQTVLNKVKIKVPSLEIQERIVHVLDNFDQICSDLKIGLPSEIEARQKQYEYYRDLLLTFDNKAITMPTDRQTDRQTDRTSLGSSSMCLDMYRLD